ncbi:MAG: formimidoylglutamate deiminase [Alphaproteobacteria bacterium]|nr:formimidoylglutamate deiminase [Alphaproteobacteria bacterium]
MTSKFRLETALTPDGWQNDVTVEVEHGRITSVGPSDGAQAERVSGVIVPALPNLHSHAFQRAMAGLTEKRGSEADSFWTWREAMYGFVEQLSPDDLEAIAALAYMEMLETGFSSVAEFHYLHQQPDGRPYDNPREMSERIVAAADSVGIALTLLPVLYCQGGFGGKLPTPGQRRFISTRDSYAVLQETKVPGGTIGIAPHSLRAVTLGDLKWVATTFAERPAHIHVSEQVREVEECIEVLGKRPIDLLMDNVAVDEHWCLVHATHADANEIARMAEAKAVVGLCPITEANLGDGLFDVPAFLKAGGRFGVGSDSLVRISAADELRTLEYGQRLIHRQRNVLGDPEYSTGRMLFDSALAGGAQALGLPVGALAPNHRADFVVLDAEGFTGDGVLDHWLFAADNRAVKTVYAAGKPVVQNGRHVERDGIVDRYRKALARLG